MKLEDIQAIESKHLIQTYARQPVLFVRGNGSKLYDDRGRQYTDFLSGIGVNVLGYNHPLIRRVFQEQNDLLHVSNLFYNAYQGPLAARLAEVSGFDRAFFCNSGTEANEAAFKLARALNFKRGNKTKTKIVAFENSFHGRTFGSLSATGTKKYREPFEPLVPGFIFARQELEEINSKIDDETAAVIVEPIQGEGGINPFPADLLQALRKRCDETGALLIFDEVQCGLGRTGKVFVFQHYNVKPDVLTLAKPLGLGVPLGVVLVRDEVATGLAAGEHGTTFGGGPLACRLSLDFLSMLIDGDLLAQVQSVGDYFKSKLELIRSNNPEIIKDVRGQGLMLGIELSFPGKPLVGAMLERSFVINCTHEVVLRFLPPYIISREEIDSMLRELEGALQHEYNTRQTD